eukprot:12160836-Alexandrium_andersonii.AAC.1
MCIRDRSLTVWCHGLRALHLSAHEAKSFGCSSPRPGRARESSSVPACAPRPGRPASPPWIRALSTW